jgi:thymidylate synthase (methanogen type)
MELRYGTIAEAWPAILRKVLNLGQVVEIEGYGKTVELDEPLMVRIRDPIHDRICKGSGWNEATLEEYYAQCCDPRNIYGFSYTYGERIHNYNGINQHRYNITYLGNHPTSRRAISSLWMPEVDATADHPPCMLIQDRSIRNGKLNVTVYFRSHAMFGAAPSNYYMLSRFIEDDAKELRVEPGVLYVVSNKAHIYWNDLKEACNVAGIPEFWKEFE